MISLSDGAKRVIEVCGAARSGEVVTVLVDPGDENGPVAAALQAAAREAGADVTVLAVDLTAPLASEVSDRVRSSDLVVSPTSTSFAHTPAAQEAARRGVRVLAMTQADAATLTGRVMASDFALVAPWCRRMADVMTSADRVRVTTRAGTDLEAVLTGRDGTAGVAMATEAGTIMGCPNIEAYVAPLEQSVNGLLVIDASTTYFGLVDEPLVIEVEHGRAVSFSGGRDADRLVELLRSKLDPSCFTFAEVGLGMNPFASLVGKIIEDESVYGTGHFALGTNTLFGGDNPSPVHADLVYHEPTVAFDDEVVLDWGRLVWKDLPDFFSGGGEGPDGS